MLGVYSGFDSILLHIFYIIKRYVIESKAIIGHGKGCRYLISEIQLRATPLMSCVKRCINKYILIIRGYYLSRTGMGGVASWYAFH